MDEVHDVRHEGDENQRGIEKRPYAKPIVVSEYVFETLALACGKCQGTGKSSSQQCRAIPQRS